MATAGDDHYVILWDVSDRTKPGERILDAELFGHTDSLRSLAFGPNGRTLATGSEDDTVILWDPTDPPHRIGAPLAGHSAPVMSVAFAPDGRTVATGSLDRTVVLWDVTDPTHPLRIGSPLNHDGAVRSLAFAPDGRSLATVGHDGAVTLWDLAKLLDLRAHAMDRASALGGGLLTSEEWALYVPGLDYDSTRCR